MSVKYRCAVCGYVYDHAIGDPDSEIPEGTSFSDLPEDWVCPVCSADIHAFEPQEAAGEPDAIRTYSNEHLTVVWVSSLCNHNGNCTRSLPEVFDIDRRPWVNVDGADPLTIRQVIDQCPTGALSYR